MITVRGGTLGHHARGSTTVDFDVDELVAVIIFDRGNTTTLMLPLATSYAQLRGAMSQALWISEPDITDFPFHGHSLAAHRGLGHGLFLSTTLQV